MVTPEDVLEFWFGSLENNQFFPAAHAPLWFKKSDQTDEMIRQRFGEALDAAQSGGLTHWEGTSTSRLALIIVLDQFSRNIYRGDARAFQSDDRAYSLARDGIARGMDQSLALVQRVFFYLPLEHAESMEAQDQSIKAFEGICNEAEAHFLPHAKDFLDYAHKHRDVILQFGRYPHRNGILGRTSTPEEEAYLARPGSGF